jgi:hypothetical protein
MNPSEKNLLQQIIELTRNLPLEDQIIVLFYVIKRWLQFTLSNLHPSRILVPVTLAQIILFALTLYHSERPFPTLAIGNFVIVGIAIFPMTLRKVKVKND